jgi:transcriptional regulator of NAD metabolism
MDAMRYMIMALPQNPYDMNTISSPYVSQNDIDRFWKTEELEERTVYVLGEGVM